MIALILLSLNLFAALFRSKSRLEAENGNYVPRKPHPERGVSVAEGLAGFGDQGNNKAAKTGAGTKLGSVIAAWLRSPSLSQLLP